MYILKVYSICTTHGDKTQILKKFPSGKINGTKIALFFFRELQLISFTLREKCRNTEFFWSVFSRIWTECGEILLICDSYIG